jgi:hypothetical protein
MGWKGLLTVGLGLLATIQAGAAPKDEATYAKVEIQGTLETGIVAIGGETTGTIVKTRDATFELDLGKDKELRGLAEKLNGKRVHVTGKLAVRKGVEIRQRFIVTVATLKAAEDKPR